MRLKLLNIFILFQLCFPGALLALTSAPDISDREVVEKLAKIEAGQQALRSEIEAGQQALRFEIKAGQQALNHRISDLRSEMKSGQEALRSEMKSGQKALDKRLDSSNNTMLVLFGSIITLIVALFAYIAWDRRTMVKPLLEQLNRLEHRVVDVVDDLDLRNIEGSLLARQLKALREYAKINPEFAEVLRGLALL